MKLSAQDAFAGLASLMLIGIVGFLAVEGKQIDAAIGGALGMALGYLFGRPDVTIGEHRG